MAKPDFNSLKPKIVAAWRTGAYSQRDIARDFGVSVGLVAKLTKGVDKDAEDIVSAGVAFRSGMSGAGEHLVSAVNSAVDERMKHVSFFNKAGLIISSAAVKRVQSGENMAMADMRHASEIVARQRDSLLGKAPDVQINQQFNAADSIKGFEVVK